jgi:ABC-type nitrate/sulfonate/bicarbonate transport system substrate-binding protein
MAAILPAIAAGADIVELMNFEPVPAYFVVAGKEIKTAGDLKGKRFGVSGQGLSNSSLAARIALKQLGLDPARDRIVLTALGNESERVLAIMAGTVAATVLAPEFRSRAEQAGVHVLADLRTSGIPWAGSDLATTRRYLQASGDKVDRFLRAILRAIAFIRDPQNKPAVLRLFREKLKVEEAALEQTYRDVLTYYLVARPYPRPDAIRFMIRESAEIVPQIGKLTPEEVAVPEPLRALDQSGFIDALYPKGRN